MSDPGLLKFELVTEEPAVLVANTIYFVKNATVNRIVISGNLPQDPLRVTSTTALENIASKMYIASGNTKEEARNSIDAAAIDHTHPEASGTVPGFLSTALYTKLMGLSNYVHPTSDGNLHVPATGTTNSGKVLKAGATAGSMSWGTLNKNDVGLNNVDNTTDAAKPVSTAQASAIATAKSEAATDATAKANAAQAAAIAASTPAAHIGTGGTSHANATTAVAGFMSETDKTKLDGIATGAQVNTVNSVAGKVGVVTLVKADVGLGNVDNTTDASKPVSTATQNALNQKSNLASPIFTGTPSAPTALVGTNTTQLATTAYVNAEIANDAAPIAHVGATGAAHGVVTTSVAGFMSAADKTKLDGIAAGAQVNTVSSVAGKTGAVTLVKADVGLSNVDNTADASKPVSTAQAAAISSVAADAAADATTKANSAQAAAISASTPSSHVGSTGTAHGVATTAVHGFMSSTDKAKLDGIAAGATANTGTVTGVTATLPVVSSGGTAPVISINAATTAAAGSMSAADKTKLDAITGTNTGDETAATIKSKLGITTLSGVNTGDQTTITGNAGTATKLQTARNINGVAFDGSANITINAVDSTARIASSEKGVAGGVATLDAEGKVPATQLPSYVDDVIEVANYSALPVTGETGKIYVTVDNNKTYRWSGSTYVFITSGAVDSVAGKTGIVTLVKADVGLSNVDNTADTAKPVSTAQASAIATAKSEAATDATTKANAAQAAAIAASTPVAHVGSSGTAHAVVTTSVAGFMSAADKTKLDGIAAGAQTNAVNSVAGKTGVVTLVKADVGLGNVDNTTDAAKPVSTATQNALNLKANAANAVLTGVPTAPTAVVGTNTTQLATTAYVNAEILADAAPISHVGSGGTSHAVVKAGGAAGFMSGADKSKLDAVTGSNTGDETAATIKSKLGITTLSGVNTGDQTTITGNAGSATKLETARTIGGVSFDGTANINLPGVNAPGNQNTSGIAATATKANALTFIDNRAVDEPPSSFVTYGLTANFKNNTAVSNPPVTASGTYSHILNISGWDALGSGGYPSQLSIGADGIAVRQGTSSTTWGGWVKLAKQNESTTGNAGSATKLFTARLIGGVSFDGTADISLPGVNAAGNQNTTGNAATATKLLTTRSINGTNFDGTANITTVNWGSSRTVTIGNTGKAVDGSANVTWSLVEIGAAPVSHTHAISDVTGLQTALDSTVKTTGDQTVAGVKTFTTGIAITGTSRAPGMLYAGTTEPDADTRLNYNGKFHATGFNTGRFMMEYNASSQSLDFNFV